MSLEEDLKTAQQQYEERQKRLRKDKFCCSKRFHTWVKEKYPSFHPVTNVKEYQRYFDEYLTLLDPWQMAQEWRVASNFKRERIYKLCKYYKDQYGENWPLPT